MWPSCALIKVTIMSVALPIGVRHVGMADIFGVALRPQDGSFHEFNALVAA